MVKIKRVALHGKFRDTLPLCGERINCPECVFESTYGEKATMGFEAARHTEGKLWVITCPNCKCAFHVEQKEGRNG